jgi:preprotein translocase subunit YajC
MAAIRTRWPDVEEALASAPETMSGPMMGQVSPAYKGDSDMDAKELETQVASLTKQLDTATKASKDGKIAVDLQKSLDELNVKLAETTTKLGEETAKAGMSDAEKAHMATLSGKDKFAFMTAAPDERKKMMAKSAEGDEVVTIEGQQVSKRAVGDAQFEIIKRQAVKIAANEAEIAKERTAREDAEFSKRAETELSHLPGETVVKVKVLRHLEKADADVKDAVSKMLEAGDKAITAAYAKLGVKGGDVTKSSNGDPKAFEKRIVEVQTANKALSRTEAMAQARKQYPEEFKVYQDQQ